MKSFLARHLSLAAVNLAVAPMFGVQLDRSFQATLPNGVIHSVLVTGEGDLLLGGEFSSLNQQTVHSFVKVNADGMIDPIFASLNPDGTVSAMALSDDGRVYVGGTFQSIGGVNAPSIACVLTNGFVDTTFVLSNAPDGRVDSLTLGANGSLLVAGAFRNLNGQPAQFIAQLNSSNASSDVTFSSGLFQNRSVETGVDALAVQVDGKVLVGGNFNTTTGFTYLSRLNADGTVDLTFTSDCGPILYVKAIRRLPHGKMLVAGTSDSRGRGFLRRLKSDGSIDPGFVEPQLDGTVEAVVVDIVGRILIGGTFNHVNGEDRGRLARLLADGKLDADWRVDANNVVKTLACDPQGRILVGGAFSEIGGVAQSGIARLNEPAELDVNSNSVSNTARIHLMLKGNAGTKYRIEGSSDLKSWSEVTTNLASNFGALEISEAIIQGSRRFFRAVSVQ